MIQIRKSDHVPAILTLKGTAERTMLENEIEAKRSEYSSGHGLSNTEVKKLGFVSDIYGHEEVKAALISEQYGKCCYCEAKFTDNGYGDVEHFRPKGAVRMQGSGSLSYPGYYWMAYDWSNLFFSCQICNQKYKKNHFPLEDEAKRKRYHDDGNDLNVEAPLLIRPDEDPNNDMEFVEEVIRPKNNSARGKESIKRYGLKRMEKSRLEYLQILDLALIFTKIDKHDEAALKDAESSLYLSRAELLKKIAQAETIFNNAAKDSGKFAGCVRAKFPHLPR